MVRTTPSRRSWDPVVDGVVEDGVHGEIAAERIVAGGAERVVVEDHVFGGVLAAFRAVGLLLLVGALAERADLGDVAAADEVDQAEALADDERVAVAEHAADLFGRGRGGNVVVLRDAVKQDVADGAADEVGLESGGTESADDVDDVGVDLVFQELGHCVATGGIYREIGEKCFWRMVSTPSSDGSRSG